MRKNSATFPATKSNALSPTQRQVLEQGAARPDLNLLPLPESLQLTGRPRLRVLRSFLDLGLAEERPCKGKAGSWRREGDGQHWALHLSKAGLAMVRPEALTSAGRRPTKQDQVLATLAAPGGATLDDLVALTGWLPHTTRAALTRLRQHGHPIALTKVGGRTAYRLVPAGGSE